MKKCCEILLHCSGVGAGISMTWNCAILVAEAANSYYKGMFLDQDNFGFMVTPKVATAEFTHMCV